MASDNDIVDVDKNSPYTLTRSITIASGLTITGANLKIVLVPHDAGGDEEDRVIIDKDITTSLTADGQLVQASTALTLTFLLLDTETDLLEYANPYYYYQTTYSTASDTYVDVSVGTLALNPGLNL